MTSWFGSDLRQQRLKIWWSIEFISCDVRAHLAPQQPSVRPQRSAYNPCTGTDSQRGPPESVRALALEICPADAVSRGSSLAYKSRIALRRSRENISESDEDGPLLHRPRLCRASHRSPEVPEPGMSSRALRSSTLRKLHTLPHRSLPSFLSAE